MESSEKTKIHFNRGRPHLKLTEGYTSVNQTTNESTPEPTRIKLVEIDTKKEKKA
jgi:hypothetical protein